MALLGRFKVQFCGYKIGMTYTNPTEGIDDPGSVLPHNDAVGNNLLDDSWTNAIPRELVGNQPGAHIENGQIRVPGIETVIAQNSPENSRDFIEPPPATKAESNSPATTPGEPTSQWWDTTGPDWAAAREGRAREEAAGTLAPAPPEYMTKEELNKWSQQNDARLATQNRGEPNNTTPENTAPAATGQEAKPADSSVITKND
jgi:hypothetical protein